MKTKTYNLFFALLGILFFAGVNATAQTTKTQTKVKSEEVKIKSEDKISTDKITSSEENQRVESLSGINLFPDKKTGNFRLRFTQNLKDSANLELKNNAGEVLFAKALSASESYTGKPMELGNLDAGIYLIEVKSANKTYWKKVRIRK
jgi:hypothetical protein